MLAADGRLSTLNRHTHRLEAAIQIDLSDYRNCPTPSQRPCPAHLLLNHIVRAQQQRLLNRDSDRLRGLHVDGELELGRPLDLHIRGLVPLMRST